jgi:CheY-like chemotaxis protein
VLRGVRLTSKGTILVAEDNDFVRLQIVTFLKAEGYAVVEATDGNAAIDAMGDDITLAVVDVRMEPMGGFEFISMIRADGMKTPVILVTGDQDSNLLERAGKSGVSVVLMKPVQKERLVASVARLIERGGR